MRRTQAGELLAGFDAPPDLAALTCRVCGTRGVTIVGLRTDDRGAHEFAWCSVECARIDGWPWLRSERARRRRRPAP